MNLKEQKDNYFIKETDKIEKYLLRIIQRYFDIENNFTQESIEAIINESLTRFKQMLTLEKGFIFSLNQQTGNITLTIRDFNGEQAFDKNTAFNKDFGTDTDTICEGNDERLYDNRKPLEHIHKIADINELQEAFKDINITTGLHNHNNKTILDILEYTGTQTQIDLIVIEFLQKSIDNYYTNLEAYKRELNVSYTKNFENLNLYIPQLEQTLLNIKDLVINTTNWLEDVYDYTTLSANVYKINVLQRLLKYASNSQIQSAIEILEKSYNMVTDGEITIANGDISLIPNDTYTDIIESKITQHTIPGSIINTVNNMKTKLFFRYNKGKEVITIPLPFIFKNESGSHIVIQGSYTESGNIIITSNIINTIPFHVEENQIYNTDTIIVCDNTDKRKFASTTRYLKTINHKICKIDSKTKNNFVSNILSQDVMYLIDGTRSFIDLKYYDTNKQELSYFNWAEGNPNTNEAYTNITITSDGKWHSVSNNEKLGFVAEYTIQRLTQYFENPRIYYQVLGNKEVT